MELNNLSELYHEIDTLRSRFGIWACGSQYLGKENTIAVSLGLDAADIAAELKKQHIPGAEFLSLDDGVITDLVDKLATRLGRKNLLIYNVDLLLSRLPHDQRQMFWINVKSGLVYRKRNVVFMIPETAERIFPKHSELEEWQQQRRFINQ